MTEYPFERAAMNNDPVPKGLNGAEQILYHGLCLIYARLHMGALDREQAKAEKFKLVQFYESIVFDCQMWERTAKMWADVSVLVQEYRENPTRRAVNRILERLYGVRMEGMPND